MRITKQSSGGRGDYEVADYAPSGLEPKNLLDHSIRLQVGSHVINTRVKVTTQGGKNRLRREDGSKASYPQVQLQLASILLLPKPVREEDSCGEGEPILRNDSYLIKNINLDLVKIIAPEQVEARVTTVEAENATNGAHEILVPQRMASIEAVWSRRNSFPSVIATLLREHEDFVRKGGPIPKRGQSLANELQGQLEVFCRDLDIPYNQTTDVLPALLSILGDVIQDEPTPLDQIPHEEMEVRRAERQKWLQYVSRRGAASIRFRKQIQAAYQFRCVMCGAHFPPTTHNAHPGIDAAHILPWSKVDLDEIYNGLALCKLHHWAFDEDLLRLTYSHQQGVYNIELSPGAESTLSGTEFSLDILRQVVGEVANRHLPTPIEQRPHPGLLEKRYSEMD